MAGKLSEREPKTQNGAPANFEKSQDMTWVYVKCKKLFNYKWTPRYATFEYSLVPNPTSRAPSTQTVIRIHKNHSCDPLFSICVSDVLEVTRTKDNKRDKPTKDDNWSIISLVSKSKCKYEFAVKDLEKNSKWEMVLKEMEYYTIKNRSPDLDQTDSRSDQTVCYSPISRIFGKAKKSLKLKSNRCKDHSETKLDIQCENPQSDDTLHLLKFNGELILDPADPTKFNFYQEDSLEYEICGQDISSDYLSVLKMQCTNEEDISNRNELLLDFVSRFKSKAVKYACQYVDNYQCMNQTGCSREDNSDEFESRKKFYVLKRSQSTNVIGDKLPSESGSSNLNRSMSSKLDLNSGNAVANKFQLFNLADDVESWKKEGISFKLVCDYKESSDELSSCRSKEASLDIQGVSLVLKAFLNNNEVDLYPAFKMYIEYKGFGILAELDSLSDSEKGFIHKMKGAVLIHDQNVLNKLTKIFGNFNLKPHQITADGACIKNIIATGIMAYLTDQKVFLTNIGEVFPLDHICDNSFCTPCDPTVDKHLNKSSSDSIKKSVASLYNSFNTISSSEFLKKPAHPLEYYYRFRPEFLQLYTGKSLCSDSYTIYSGGSPEEALENNVKSSDASKFLRNIWIPMFAESINNLIIRPVDSYSLSNSMHAAGINMRYLGILASHVSVKSISILIYAEMIARATKELYRSTLRNKILYFIRIGATRIMQEEEKVVFSIIRSIIRASASAGHFLKFIKPLVQSKFNFQMTQEMFNLINIPTLVHAIEYNWSISIHGEYTEKILSSGKGLKVMFFPKVKFPCIDVSPNISGIDSSLGSISTKFGTVSNSESILDSIDASAEEISFVDQKLPFIFYKSIKENSYRDDIMQPNGIIDGLIVAAAAYCNKVGLYKEAEIYASMVIERNPHNTLMIGLAYCQKLISKFKMIVPPADSCTHSKLMLQDHYTTVLYPELTEIYDKAGVYLRSNLGEKHIAIVMIHDIMAQLSFIHNQYEDAVTFCDRSLSIILDSLGKRNRIVAHYYAKLGRFCLKVLKYDQAIYNLTLARQILEYFPDSFLMSTEVDIYLSEAYSRKGVYDSALQYVNRACIKREETLGRLNLYTMRSYIQAIHVLLLSDDFEGKKKETEYKSFINKRTLISYMEKVFMRYKICGMDPATYSESGLFNTEYFVSCSQNNIMADYTLPVNPQSNKFYLQAIIKQVKQGIAKELNCENQIKPDIHTEKVAEKSCNAFSRILFERIPLSCALAGSTKVTGPLLDSKFIVPAVLDSRTICFIVMKLVKFKILNVKEDDTSKTLSSASVSTINSNVNEKVDEFVIRNIFSTDVSVYINGVIKRIKNNDPIAHLELESCMRMCSKETLPTPLSQSSICEGSEFDGKVHLI